MVGFVEKLLFFVVALLLRSPPAMVGFKDIKGHKSCCWGSEIDDSIEDAICCWPPSGFGRS